MRIREMLIVVLAAWSLLAEMANADGWGPTKEMAEIFSAKNQENLCGQGTRVEERFLIYDVASKYELNIAELSRKSSTVKLPNGASLPVAPSYEEVIAGWLANEMVTTAGLKDATAESLSAAQIALADLLEETLRGQKMPGFNFRTVPVLYDEEKAEILGSSAKMIAAAFSETLSDRYSAASIEIDCVEGKGPIAQTNQEGTQKTEGVANRLWAVRSNSDDIAVSYNDKAVFKKLDPAKLSYTENRAEEKTSSTADISLGYGIYQNTVDHVHAFLSYKNNDTDTKKTDDDDTSKDIRALSPGIMWSRASKFGVGKLDIFSTLGATAYATFDSAQDSETGRIRLFSKEMAFNVPGGATAVCGSPYQFLGEFLQFDCRFGVFLEFAHVFKAGKSKDFETLEDDQYAGAGAEFWLIFGFGAKYKFLTPFQIRSSYKTMKVFSGKLDDPSTFTASLAYEIGKSNFEVAITYEDGQDFDTFTDIETLKLSAGWKY